MTTALNYDDNRGFDKIRLVAYGILIGTALILFAMSLNLFFFGVRDSKSSPSPSSIDIETPVKADDGLWDGPILYHKGSNEPIHFILVEKALQKLSLYRFDGSYQLVKSYPCVTGEQQGEKRREKDEKTPEGIYFNVKSYRDTKITIFGDRAFGLNYPDAFDDFEGKGGSGIFIHGSNRAIKPFSTNGCLVLDNQHLADLDKSIQFQKTPVIIGERLPYRFATAKRDVSELIPVLKQAMLPKRYTLSKPEFSSMTIFGLQERVVALSDLMIKAPEEIHGFSKLYLVKPDKDLFVLIKREWREDKPKIALAQKKSHTLPTEVSRITLLVEAWRRAWEKKDLNNYIAYYHPAFISNGKNLYAWKRYKKKLIKRNQSISIKVSGLRIKVYGNRAFAYFKQRYRSDTYRADGYKRIEFKKKGDGWKIFRERWFAKEPDNWPR